jgi:hypothetical protein
MVPDCGVQFLGRKSDGDHLFLVSIEDGRDEPLFAQVASGLFAAAIARLGGERHRFHGSTTFVSGRKTQTVIMEIAGARDKESSAKVANCRGFTPAEVILWTASRVR